VNIRGRTWCFGDDVNTDLILPIDVIPLPRSERPQHMFRANRPGWSDLVEPGDVLIAGTNYGMGSSRPASQVMKDLGLACVVAESVNGLFFRNSVNFAFPTLEVPDVRSAFEEGDIAIVDFEAGTVKNERTDVVLPGVVWPPELLAIMRAGGLLERLETTGLLHPEGWLPEPGAIAPV
jgi:3-isopropylmalate/(R)-2-methylmalate dehydratase small subunit